MVLAIDPGNVESAFVLIDDEYRPIKFDKMDNFKLKYFLTILLPKYKPEVVIEMIGHYGTGMAAGKTVFDTCLWIGRFIEVVEGHVKDATLMLRKDVKINLCGQMKAKDANISQYLRDRFGEKGTKANPGWFYGFKADIWQAYALGVAYMDTKNG